MKTLIATLLCVISAAAFGQFSRSFYTHESTDKRTGALVERNGQLTFVHAYTDDGTSLKGVMLDLDDEGETSNYIEMNNSLTLPIISQLSGAGVDNNTDIVLAMLEHVSGSLMHIHYIRINATGQIVFDYSPAIDMDNGYVRTIQKGDSLITYYNDDQAQLQRLSASINDPSNYSIEAVGISLGYSGSLASSQQKAAELLFDGNDEYFLTGYGVIKRTGTGNYMSASFSFSFGIAMDVNNANELVVLKGNNYYVFDQNLNQTSTGMIPYNSPQGAIELITAPNGYVIYHDALQTRLFLDGGFNLAYGSDFQREVKAHKVYKFGGEVYVIGSKEESVNLNVDLNGGALSNPYNNSKFVVKEGLDNFGTAFIEYGQSLFHENTIFYTSHIGTIFSAPQNKPGFVRFDGAYFRSLIYSGFNSAIGLNGSGIEHGTGGNYNSDLLPGPYTNTADYTHEIQDKYNRGYYVTRQMIDNHLSSLGDPSYTMPFGIKHWPAHGNVTLGQSGNLAPFIDYNTNGMYDPENGDYPAIYGHKCLLNIFHQSPNSTFSGHLESHQYYFTFDCDTSNVLKNTVFIKQDFFGRGMDLDSVYLGTFADFDIGNPMDDYVGTNVDLGMIYGYNGDAFDEQNGGNQTFEDSLPAVGAMILRGAKQPADQQDNFVGVGPGQSINGFGFGDGIIDNEYYTLESSVHATNTGNTDPNDLIGYYQVLQGREPSSLAQQHNGIQVRHSFFGDSDPQFYTSGGIDHGNNYWENGAQGDRRMYGGSGAAQLNIGDTLGMITAYIYAIDETDPTSQNAVNKLFVLGSELKQSFKNNEAGCGYTFTPYVSPVTVGISELNTSSILVFPNPLHKELNIRGASFGSDITLTDLSGKIILKQHVTSSEVTINMEHLTAAIYLLVIEDGNGRQVIRVAKQ